MTPVYFTFLEIPPRSSKHICPNQIKGAKNRTTKDQPVHIDFGCKMGESHLFDGLKTNWIVPYPFLLMMDDA